MEAADKARTVKEILASLSPVQECIYNYLCARDFVTRRELLDYLHSMGFYNGLSLPTADRYMREEKEDMLLKGVPIGSSHGVADKNKNAKKKADKGYFLAWNGKLQAKGEDEYEKKIHTMSINKNLFVQACHKWGTFKSPPKKGQMSLPGVRA